MWLGLAISTVRRGASVVLGTVFKYLYEAGGSRVLDANSNVIKVKS